MTGCSQEAVAWQSATACGQVESEGGGALPRPLLPAGHLQGSVWCRAVRCGVVLEWCGAELRTVQRRGSVENCACALLPPGGNC